MNSADKQSRVGRYSEYKPKIIIQFNCKNQPLFSADDFKYIGENRNRDICVSDKEASVVVVVNQAGKPGLDKLVLPLPPINYSIQSASQQIAKIGS